MSEISAKPAKGIEFFSAADLDKMAPGEVGPGVPSLKVDFPPEADKAAWAEGIELFGQQMKSFASKFDDTGLHLGVIEFGPNLVSPLHSHSDNCIYYVERGSIIMGNRTLGPGEGFVTRTNQPYGFVTGPEGLRLIEFTKGPRTDIAFHERQAATWKARLEQAVANKGEVAATV